MTHTITKTYTSGGAQISGTQQVTSDAEFNADLTLAPASSGVELDVTLTRANIKSCCLICDADATVTPYNGGSAGTPISLSAGVPTIASNNTEAQAIFSANVTKFLISCTAGGNFKFRSCSDITP